MEKDTRYIGLKSASDGNEREISHEAEQSVYYWLWSYLRLSPVLWFAREIGAMPRDESIAKVVELVGDLKGKNFRKWWRQTGSVIFAENIELPAVKLLGVDIDVESPMSTSETLYLEIPLSISKASIISQVRGLLNANHAGRVLDLMGESTAQFPLYTHRYRLRSLEIQYWVLLYRLLYDEVYDWQIGDRLQIAPHHKVREEHLDVHRKHRWHSTPRALLGAITGRHLYKGRFTLLHAERGEFPNDDPIRLSDRFQPFGLKLQTEFREATESRDGKRSAWHQWLHQQFGADLLGKVMDCNHFRISQFRADRPSKRLQEFVEGSMDWLF